MLDIRTILDAMYSNALEYVSPITEKGRKLTIRRRRREDDGVEENTNAMYTPAVDEVVPDEEYNEFFAPLKGDIASLYIDSKDQEDYVKNKDSKLKSMMNTLAHELQHGDDFNRDPTAVRRMLNDYNKKAGDLSTDEGYKSYYRYPLETRAEIRAKIQDLCAQYNDDDKGTTSFKEYLMNYLRTVPMEDEDNNYKNYIYKTFYKMADTIEDFENDPRHVGLSSDKRLKNIVKHNKDSFR